MAYVLGEIISVCLGVSDKAWYRACVGPREINGCSVHRLG